MSTIHVSDLCIYPIKSMRAIHQDLAQLQPTGLQYDRQWAIFDSHGQALTAREYPQLLALQPRLTDNVLEIYRDDTLIHQFDITNDSQDSSELQLFSYKVRGVHVSANVDTWYSEYLGLTCQLMQMNQYTPRPVLAKHGGLTGDVVSYADQCPILLISEASLVDLNQRLPRLINMAHFRPNIVVAGCEPYAEDNWKQLHIGDQRFDVNQSCIRCVFTTIDPETHQRDPQGEPLHTLATYRKQPSGVAFGMHLTARTSGHIRLGDPVQIQ